MKKYNDLSTYLKKRFGHKVYKISLSTGCTCPNRDGKISYGGCIFCSEGGSGDFAASAGLPVSEQIKSGKKLIEAKLKNFAPENISYIAYFQSFTNTYAPVEKLEKIFYETAEFDEISVISIATRPDCLSDDCIKMLEKLNTIKPVWIELGLQTIHEATAEYINRGYTLDIFENSLKRLKEAGIEVIVHVILGLPGESEEMMLETVRYLSELNIDGIKLQLLHVLKHTRLGNIFLEQYSLLSDLYSDNELLLKTAEKLKLNIVSQEMYVDIVKKCIEIIPERIVIHRLTGDAPRKDLIYPLWSTDKKRILNSINKS